MDPRLQPGVTAEYTVEVTEDMIPSFDGVVVHHVYSTWSLAHHMEIVARRVLAPHLEPGEEGIGTHLSIDHLAPTPVGKTVRLVARCTDVDAGLVVCDVEAFDADRLVAKGVQHQRVLPRAVIDKLVAKHQA